jgi:hypothetical protein
LGTDTTRLLALQLLGVARVPLNLILPIPCVAPKLAPLIVTAVPTGPEVGDRLVTLGAGVAATSTKTSFDMAPRFPTLSYACAAK